ncbi:MAG: fasciclin domain-containing protein [Candidatus Thiothrix sulfatifontis]|nr:MAG: fasciclin domain-containing protein [Candidatus Thiothrix sulfatifontis]
MMKTGNYEKASAAQAAPVAEATKDIVDTAVAAGSFNTLAAALTAAGLVDALKAEGPFTVFAPNDEAFAKIPKADLDNLLKDKEKLATVLKYHVVSGKVTAADVGKLTTADTLAELPVKIDTTSGVKINDSTVIQADVMASNGVIHVIDTVLMPPAK